MKKTENNPIYFEAKENPLFPPELTALIRFVKYPKPVQCEYCGRRSIYHWTMICAFRVADMEERAFSVTLSNRVFAARAPICRKHMMQPETENANGDVMVFFRREI